jgi:hypothetical protein
MLNDYRQAFDEIGMANMQKAPSLIESAFAAGL